MEARLSVTERPQLMKRRPLWLIKSAVPLVSLLVLILPVEAQGSPSEGLRAQAMMSCGKGSNGWYLWKGAGVPGMPNTKCSFVRATHRKLVRRGNLPRRFTISVRGNRLSCKKRRYIATEVFVTCKSRTKWVGQSR